MKLVGTLQLRLLVRLGSGFRSLSLSLVVHVIKTLRRDLSVQMLHPNQVDMLQAIACA